MKGVTEHYIVGVWKAPFWSETLRKSPALEYLAIPLPAGRRIRMDALMRNHWDRLPDEIGDAPRVGISPRINYIARLNSLGKRSPSDNTGRASLKSGPMHLR